MGKKNIVGPMRHQLKLQVEAQTADGGGGYALAWTTAATVWGSVKPVGGREHIQTDQLADVVSHRIIIRYCTDITFTGKYRILWGTRAFNVKRVVNIDERNKYFELFAEEGVAT